MRNKIKFPWRFTRKVTNTGTVMPSMPSKKVIPSNRWYHSIATLTLNRFIDVAVDGNFSALVIAGRPADEDLHIAWAEIKHEYADAIGDQEHRLYICLFKDIQLINIKLKEVHIIIDKLSQFYYKPLADKLNALLFTSFNFDPNNPHEYYKILKNCFNRAKGWQLDLELKIAHFTAIQEKNEGKEGKCTREYFQSILISVSDHAKYYLQDDITVFEFCERIKRFNKYCEQMEKQAQKYGR